MFKLVGSMESVALLSGHFIGEEDSFKKWLDSIEDFIYDEIQFTKEPDGRTKVTFYIHGLGEAEDFASQLEEEWGKRLEIDS